MEKKKIVIGYDGSNIAEQVVGDLKWAGLPDNTQATVLSAADVLVPADVNEQTPREIRPALMKAKQISEEALRVAESLSEHGAKEVKSLFPKWKVYSESFADSPAWALIKKADAWRADLIVVGAHGRSQMGRFIGSVSQLVLVHASKSVRIARPRPNSADANLRILIGIDGSLGSRAAIQAVLNRTWSERTKVVLLGVLEPKMSTLMKRASTRGEDERDTLVQMLEFYGKQFREMGLSVHCQVATGDPKQVIVQEAEKWETDSIFLGARGLSNFKRLMVGGVSAAVSARAHCSVEVVR